MKKLIAILPANYDWSRAFGDGLTFGVTAAVAVRVLPAISRACVQALNRFQGTLTASGSFPAPLMKIFGQGR